MAEHETIRQWYDRTTRRARRALLWASVIAVVAGVILWSLASFGTLQRIQTFQGAFSIPVVGGLWVLSFVFIFLIPSREVSFRSQESIEETVLTLKGTAGEIKPVIATWKRIGDEVEKELPSWIKEMKAALAEVRQAAKDLHALAEKNGAFIEEARPVLKKATEVTGRIELELRMGLPDEIRAAARDIRLFTGIPDHPSEPDYSLARRAKDGGNGRR